MEIMMSISYRIVIIISSIFLIITVWSLIKRGLFRPAYALLWFFGSFAILLLALFPEFIPFVAGVFGVDYPPSVAFAFGIFILIILLLNQTIYLSTFARLNKELAQNYALLQYRLERLEGIMAREQGGNIPDAKEIPAPGEKKNLDPGVNTAQTGPDIRAGDINMPLTQT
jgi:hypothetical protein